MHRCCESKWSFSFAPPPPSPKLNFWLRPWREWSEILRDCRSTLRFQEREITEAARVQVCLVWVCRGKVRALLRRLELGFERERERERERVRNLINETVWCVYEDLYIKIGAVRFGSYWFTLPSFDGFIELTSERAFASYCRIQICQLVCWAV